ncbi:MAG TPA: TonB family protein [Bryobacteraceae bacterium]|nr:TonB family protein [Bryobacteraceae bacterium]
MRAHVDILEQRDSLKRPIVISVAAHAALATAIVLYTQIGLSGALQWGTPNSLGGGSVGVSSVKQVPLPPRSGAANPLANDTESRVPAPPKPEVRKTAPREDPDAIALRTRKKPPEERPRYGQQARNSRMEPGRPNQLYSTSGQALSSNMYGNASGTGGVGVGSGSAFGSRFGWYRDLLERRIAEKWRTDEVDPRLQTAPPAIVTFTIQRNGTIGDVRILQTSGNYALDNSSKRAVYEASPLPELPRDYDRNSAQIEIWFQLKR